MDIKPGISNTDSDLKGAVRGQKMGEQDALKLAQNPSPYSPGYKPNYDAWDPSNRKAKAPGSQPVGDQGAAAAPSATNPYQRGYQLPYDRMDPHSLSYVKPQPPQEVQAKMMPAAPAKDGIHLVGLERYLHQSQDVNLGTIALDQNGKPIAEVLPGKEAVRDPRTGEYHVEYYIQIHYSNPIAENIKYHFGPQLQNILYRIGDNGQSVPHSAKAYRDTADYNEGKQQALHRSERIMQQGGIQLFNPNSGLNRLQDWAGNLATACYPALKMAEAALRADVQKYPNEPYSKIRLAQITFAESFNPENIQRQQEMRENSVRLLQEAERISCAQLGRPYDPTNMSVSSIGFNASPYFEGALVPSTYWEGALSQSSQCINQFDQFFHQSARASQWSNTPKSPSFYSKYVPRQDGMYQNPQYGTPRQNLNMFPPRQYPSGVPYMPGDQY
jgi:hypothetical protein